MRWKGLGDLTTTLATDAAYLASPISYILNTSPDEALNDIGWNSYLDAEAGISPFSGNAANLAPGVPTMTNAGIPTSSDPVSEVVSNYLTSNQLSMQQDAINTVVGPNNIPSMLSNPTSGSGIIEWIAIGAAVIIGLEIFKK